MFFIEVARRQTNPHQRLPLMTPRHAALIPYSAALISPHQLKPQRARRPYAPFASQIISSDSPSHCGHVECVIRKPQNWIRG